MLAGLGSLELGDIHLLNGSRLGAFLRDMQFSRPIYERLIRALWQRLGDVDQLGSLLRLEQEMGELIAAERARYRRMDHQFGELVEVVTALAGLDYSQQATVYEGQGSQGSDASRHRSIVRHRGQDAHTRCRTTGVGWWR